MSHELWFLHMWWGLGLTSLKVLIDRTNANNIRHYVHFYVTIYFPDNGISYCARWSKYQNERTSCLQIWSEERRKILCHLVWIKPRHLWHLPTLWAVKCTPWRIHLHPTCIWRALHILHPIRQSSWRCTALWYWSRVHRIHAHKMVLWHLRNHLIHCTLHPLNKRINRCQSKRCLKTSLVLSSF